MNITDNNGPCPCGSGEDYLNCCGAIHTGLQQAQTAEKLMRARYSAFVKRNESYLMESWHVSTRPEHVLDKDTDKTEWLGLNIVNTELGQPGDKTGTVEFIARFRVHKQPGQLHENSTFRFEEGQWFYIDGEPKKGVSVKSLKTGRNEPCPCGSGKKFKKCCGA